MVRHRAPGILCVDDSADMLEMLAAYLEARGYRVLTTDSPDLALRRLAEEPIDAMIVDYEMPGMNGAILAALAKSLHEELIVVMLSGSVVGSPGELFAVDRFIAKGESAAALDQELCLLLGRHAPDSGNGPIYGSAS
jgi:CheY-like chemotaxis protein